MLRHKSTHREMQAVSSGYLYSTSPFTLQLNLAASTQNVHVLVHKSTTSHTTNTFSLKMPMSDEEVEGSIKDHFEGVEGQSIKNEYVGRAIPCLPCIDEILALCGEEEKKRIGMEYGPAGFKYPLEGSPIACISNSAAGFPLERCGHSVTF
jgi:hypothetical protein